jgi:hypothetical protein
MFENASAFEFSKSAKMTKIKKRQFNFSSSALGSAPAHNTVEN